MGPEGVGPKGKGPMGARRGGGPNPEKVGPEMLGGPKGLGPKFRAFFFPLPPPAARSGGAAGVSDDNQRAQTCTFEGPGLRKHHQNSTRRHPEREEKNEFCGGRGKKKSDILGGPGEGRSRGRAVQGKGGPGEGRSRGRAARGRAARGRAVQGEAEVEDRWNCLTNGRAAPPPSTSGNGKWR